MTWSGVRSSLFWGCRSGLRSRTISPGSPRRHARGSRTRGFRPQRHRLAANDRRCNQRQGTGQGPWTGRPSRHQERYHRRRHGLEGAGEACRQGDRPPLARPRTPLLPRSIRRRPPNDQRSAASITSSSRTFRCGPLSRLGCDLHHGSPSRRRSSRSSPRAAESRPATSSASSIRRPSAMRCPCSRSAACKQRPGSSRPVHPRGQRDRPSGVRGRDLAPRHRARPQLHHNLRDRGAPRAGAPGLGTGGRQGISDEAQVEADAGAFDEPSSPSAKPEACSTSSARYTGKRIIKAHRAKIEAIHADLLSLESLLPTGNRRLKRIEAMIANCTMRAPRDGTVVYANRVKSWGTV